MPWNFAWAIIIRSPVETQSKKGVNSHPIHIGGAKMLINLQISRLKLKVHLKNTQQ